MSIQKDEMPKLKQKITRNYNISDEEKKKRSQAQAVLRIVTSPVVVKILGGMMGAVNAVTAPFKKVKADNALFKNNYFKNSRWFYYNAVKVQRDDMVAPKLPEPDKNTLDIINSMVNTLAISTLSRDTNIYHAKIVNHDDMKRILTLKEDINITPSEKAMPYKVARQLILESQDTFCAAPCLCRNATADSCVPKDRLSCIYVGKDNVEFVLARSYWAKPITKDQALEIIEQARSDGLVHTVFWNKWVGEGPFCLCNCCSCHCAGIGAWNLSGGLLPMFAKSGKVAQIDPKKCKGCGTCVNACHFEAISINGTTHVAVVEETKCVGCEVCLGICPNGAKSMTAAPDGSIPIFAEVKKNA